MIVPAVDSDSSLAPLHSSLLVRSHWGDLRVRNMIQVSGVSPPRCISAYNDNLAVLVKGVLERVFYVKGKHGFEEPPRPRGRVTVYEMCSFRTNVFIIPPHFSNKMSQVRKLLSKYLPKTAPLERLQFVDTFKGRKKLIYSRAEQSLLVDSLTKKDAGCRVFPKWEKQDQTDKTPVGRIISPRDPRYNVEVGRFIRPIEERIFDSIGKLFGDTTVLKGMNAWDRAACLKSKWDSFLKPVAIGLDASRFDQHVSVDALQWEHKTYIECFPNQRHKSRLQYLLDMQLYNKCQGWTRDGMVKYTTNGGRMSGDMNTSLGNCLLMSCMVYQYSLDTNTDIKLANDGDDCVVFLNQDQLSRFMTGIDKWFLEMGFTMKVEEPVYEFERIVCCQSQPVLWRPEEDLYVMCRNPILALAKDSVCLHSWESLKLYKGWLYAVGCGGESLTSGLPIFQQFYELFKRSGVEVAGVKSGLSWGVRQLIGDSKKKFCEVHPATRVSFCTAFGIEPDDQLIAEQYYSSISLTDQFVEHQYRDDMP